MFDGLDNATPQGNTKTIGDGRATVQVLGCEAIDNGRNGVSFIALIKILESDNSEDPVDCIRKIAINGLTMPARREIALGTLKSFLAAVVNADPDSQTPCEGYTWQTLASFITSAQSVEWFEQNEKKIVVDSYMKLNKEKTYEYKVWSFSSTHA